MAKHNEQEQDTNNSAKGAARDAGALLNRKAEIKAQIREVKNDIEETLDKKGQLESSGRELRNSLAAIQGREMYADRQQELTVQLQQNQGALDEVERSLRALENGLIQLETRDLPDCIGALREQDIMEHRRKIQAATSEVGDIQSAINDQQRVITELTATIPAAPDRGNERRTLLADIALGKASRDTLDKLDSEIADQARRAAEATAEVSSKVADAQAALEGLRHKLDIAHKKLMALNSQIGEVARFYYVGEAQVLAAQYVNHALDLRNLYLRLLALDALIKDHDKYGIVRVEAQPMRLPMFSLPQFDGVGSIPVQAKAMILDGEYIRHGDEAVKKVAHAEKAKFDALIR